MAIRIEVRHDDIDLCESCGAGAVVASALRPERVDPLPVDHDADLAAEVSGLEAQLRELLQPPGEWWAARAGRVTRFGADVERVVNHMKGQTVRANA